MINAKTFVLISGIPGAGKSTLAHLIARENSAVICEADEFMVENGLYKFDQTKLKDCHNKCKDKFRAAVEAGLNVIQSNTNLQGWESEFYIDLARQHGYKIQEIILKSDFENVHNVPTEKLEEMRKRFQY